MATAANAGGNTLRIDDKMIIFEADHKMSFSASWQATHCVFRIRGTSNKPVFMMEEPYPLISIPGKAEGDMVKFRIDLAECAKLKRTKLNPFDQYTMDLCVCNEDCTHQSPWVNNIVVPRLGPSNEPALIVTEVTNAGSEVVAQPTTAIMTTQPTVIDVTPVETPQASQPETKAIADAPTSDAPAANQPEEESQGENAGTEALLEEAFNASLSNKSERPPRLHLDLGRTPKFRFNCFWDDVPNAVRYRAIAYKQFAGETSRSVVSDQFPDEGDWTGYQLRDILDMFIRDDLNPTLTLEIFALDAENKVLAKGYLDFTHLLKVRQEQIERIKAETEARNKKRAEEQARAQARAQSAVEKLMEPKARELAEKQVALETEAAKVRAEREAAQAELQKAKDERAKAEQQKAEAARIAKQLEERKATAAIQAQIDAEKSAAKKAEEETAAIEHTRILKEKEKQAYAERDAEQLAERKQREESAKTEAARLEEAKAERERIAKEYAEREEAKTAELEAAHEQLARKAKELKEREAKLKAEDERIAKEREDLEKVKAKTSKDEPSKKGFPWIYPILGVIALCVAGYVLRDYLPKKQSSAAGAIPPQDEASATNNVSLQNNVQQARRAEEKFRDLFPILPNGPVGGITNYSGNVQVILNNGIITGGANNNPNGTQSQTPAAPPKAKQERRRDHECDVFDLPATREQSGNQTLRATIPTGEYWVFNYNVENWKVKVDKDSNFDVAQVTRLFEVERPGAAGDEQGRIPADSYSEDIHGRIRSLHVYNNYHLPISIKFLPYRDGENRA